MSRRKTTIVMGMVAARAVYAYPARAVNVDKQVQAPVHADIAQIEAQITPFLAGEDTLVNIFRLGRLRLFDQTLDKQACGSWLPLPKAYLKTVQAAVDMGSKRNPLALLDLA